MSCSASLIAPTARPKITILRPSITQQFVGPSQTSFPLNEAHAGALAV